MKRIPLLILLCCAYVAAFSQPATVTVNATGAAGSYKSGYINNTATPSRNDGNLQVHSGSATPTNDKRGWAVFNLPTVVPPAATVTAVSLRFTVLSTANIVNATTVGIYGFAGDLSTITSPATAYADCNGSGTYAGVSFNSTQWGGRPTTNLLTLNASGISFINASAASAVSLGWQCNSDSTQTYTIAGETAAAGSQPQLTITYNCTGVSGVVATATPTNLCAGTTLQLTALGTGVNRYSWSGPGGFISTLQNPTSVVSVASAGVYTLTAYSPGNCPTTTTTATVTVNPQPSAIIKPSSFLCTGHSFTLSDRTPGGTWSTVSTSTATIDPATQSLTGVSPGDVAVIYTSSVTTCAITTTVTIVAPPVAITGANSVCVGQSVAISESGIGGTWSSGNTTLATVNTTANVFGVSMGIANITYDVGAGCYISVAMTVNPLAPILGPDSVCRGSSVYVTDIVGGGTWTSTPVIIASIDSAGYFTGLGAGTAHVTYTTPAGCITTQTMAVVAIPPAITGIMHTCPGASTTLFNTTHGGIWTTNDAGIATVSTATGSGTVYGVGADTTTITYTVRPGCSVTALVLVDPLPAPITGRKALCATLTDTLYDDSLGGIWSSLTTPVATVVDTSGVVFTVSGGNAIIVYTLPVTGCKITDTVTVHPLPTPVISYNWQTASLYVDSIYVSYQWYDDLEGLIPGATSPSLAALYTENYHVVVTDHFGCTASSPLFLFDATVLGVKNPASAQINIYPNPATASVYITSTVNVRAVISSLDGKTLLEQASAKEINISALATGMYFITLYNDDNQVLTVRKLVKE